MESFAEFLKDAKDKLKMNRMEFASLLGYPIDTVTKYYQGYFMPSKEKQKKIIRIIKKALG